MEYQNCKIVYMTFCISCQQLGFYIFLCTKILIFDSKVRDFTFIGHVECQFSRHSFKFAVSSFQILWNFQSLFELFPFEVFPQDVNQLIRIIFCLLQYSVYIGLCNMVLQANNEAGGGAGDAAEGGGGEENADNAEDHADDEENNAANQDAENGAQNGDGQ